MLYNREINLFRTYIINFKKELLTFIKILDLKLPKRVTLPEYNFFSTQMLSLNWCLMILYSFLVIRFMNLNFAALLLSRWRVHNLDMTWSINHFLRLPICASWLRPSTLARAAYCVTIRSQIVSRIHLWDLNAVWMRGSILLQKSICHSSIYHLLAINCTPRTMWRFIQTLRS